MKHFCVVFIVCLYIRLSSSDSVVSLVVSSTESSKEGKATSDIQENEVNPQIYSMNIHTNITNRFATTLVTSKVRNLKHVAAQTTFSVVLPENAFISAFEMEIESKVYKAYVKEKEEAKRIYEKAISQGQSAGHVELSARDSKTFTVSVNIEPESKTIFRLTYEELLQRQLGHYDLVVNIHPGQIVDDLSVVVFINETRPLMSVQTPALRTGNEISKNEENLKPSADIELINSTSAIVKFHPDIRQQKEFAQNLGSKKENGLAGQFIVQYEVERDPHGGEVLVRDGYFVHFFSPSELAPLKKHLVFVLDHSGSMSGRKIEQLNQAMQNILSQLGSNDLFNMVRFSGKASVWNATSNNFDTINADRNSGNLASQLKELNLPQAASGTIENVEKAKKAIENIYDLGLTNIVAGLETGLFLIKKTHNQFPREYQPIMIFLTDGLPNVDVNSGDEIIKIVSKLNSGEDKAIIFSLSFGSGADKSFMRKLSAENLGFSRHIFEAADSSLQLQDFYKRISSPVLSNVTFKYIDNVSEVTKTHFPILFNGSELVISGRTGESINVLKNVIAICPRGPIKFEAQKTEPVSSLERLWAYLTVQQILKEREIASDKTGLTKKALDLALKYSFVTSVSSLVVVKPNKTDAVESKDTNSENSEENLMNFSALRGGPRLGGAMYTSGAAAYPRMSAGLHGRRLYGKSWHGRSYLPAHGSTRRPRVLKASSKAPVTTLQLPTWIENIRNNNLTISTPQGDFKLGSAGIVTTKLPCSNAPQNSTGLCTLIFECPEVFPMLSDITVYLKYFCPLNEYAGVCCPQKQPIATNP